MTIKNSFCECQKSFLTMRYRSLQNSLSKVLVEAQSLGEQNPDWKNTGGCRKQSSTGRWTVG